MSSFWEEVGAFIATLIISYVLQPKPKADKPAAAQDMDAPTADAGRPVPVVFGTVTVKGLNILGYWDKSTLEREVKT